MHANTGLSDTADRETVMNATLDKFADMFQNAIVVDDDIPIEKWMMEYVKTCSSTESLCFYDCTSILDQYKTWFQIFNNVQPFYAMKCNPSSGMMDLMSTFPGICVDCAGKDEINACLSRGISPDHIIYANPVKSDDSIEFMREKNVWCSTVDCVEEIEKMHRILGEDCSKCRTVLRLWVDDNHSMVSLGSKFGCHLDEVESIFQAMKKCNMPAVGVSFHVGSGNTDELAYEKAICNAHCVFELGKKYGYQMNLLDLGGGWSGTLGGKEHVNESLQSTYEVICRALAKYHFDEVKDLKIISEPGRYFNEETITVLCTIEHVSSKGGRRVYRINEGVMGVFKDRILCNMDYPPFALLEDATEREMCLSCIIGPSNRDIDVIAKDIMLPSMNVGDRILFKHAGAYTLSLTTLTLRHNQKYIYYIRKSSLSRS